MKLTGYNTTRDGDTSDKRWIGGVDSEVDFEKKALFLVSKGKAS
jgi:hypothetical protein